MPRKTSNEISGKGDSFAKEGNVYKNTYWSGTMIAVQIIVGLVVLGFLIFGTIFGLGSSGGSTNRCEGVTSTATGGAITNREDLGVAVLAWIDEPEGAKVTYGGDINTWDVSQVIDMSGLFKEANTFDSDIGCWDTSSVVAMAGMFAGATAFNQDISKWDVSKVEDFDAMFADSTAFDNNEGDKQTFRNWEVREDLEGITKSMFSGATAMDTKYGPPPGLDVPSYNVSPNPSLFFNQNFS